MSVCYVLGDKVGKLPDRTSNSKRLEVKVSRLGAIIASVMTPGLKGMIPVFLNVARMLAQVNACICALA